jgi:hypothetical protein
LLVLLALLAQEHPQLELQSPSQEQEQVLQPALEQAQTSLCRTSLKKMKVDRKDTPALKMSA